MKFIKKALSILLAAALLMAMLPTAFANKIEEKLNYTKADAAFAAIESAIEIIPQMRAKDSQAKAEAAKAAVQSLGYEIKEQGDRFTWTADGVVCAYSPRLQEIAENAKPIEGYVDDGQIVTVNYGTRANGPEAKDVALFEPYYGLDSSFTKQYQTECTSIAKATGGTYTLYKTSAATIDAIADELQTSAAVFFDSHGDTDFASGDDYTSRANTSYICLQSGDGLTQADQAEVIGTFGEYYHAAYTGSNGSMKYYCVDGTAITNHMTGDMPNNFVWMAICLGMATDGMCQPFMNKGAGVVYGYSQSVTFDGDYLYEETFWTSMKGGSTVKAAIAEMKNEHGNWDPAYGGTISQARKEYAAFPIVVSALDAYPGHGNVDDYQTVNSDWTLDEVIPFTITAKSADTAKGTVSLNGKTITAAPAQGYYASGYTVSPAGACTVTQNGNSFQLTNIQQNCTVTISFAAKTPVTITYSVPAGVTCPPTKTYAGDSTMLATPNGTPDADAQSYRFAGWVKAETADTTQKPDIYAAGSSYNASVNQTFYALYTYMQQDGSALASGEFVPVAGEMSDWSGEYVLTSSGTHILDASGEYLNTAIGSKDASLTLAQAGCTRESDILQGVGSACVYVITAVSQDTYSIRMRNSDNYLSYTAGGGNTLTTASHAATNAELWTITYANDSCSIQNVGSPDRSLCYNSTSDVFRCYTSGQKPMKLYTGSVSTTYYTTGLSYKASCENGHDFGAWVIVTPATCKTTGSQKRVCNRCGETETQEIAIIPHSWQAGVATTPATCTEPGLMTYTCSQCGETKTEVIAALTHSWDAGTAITPVSCTAPYEMRYTCSRCGETKTETVAAPGHSFVREKEDYFYTYSCCSRCGETKTEENAPFAYADSPSKDYGDIEDSWYRNGTDYVIITGIMSSTSTEALTFEPNTDMTRAMLVTMLYRLEKAEPVEKPAKTFTDVPAGQWYTNAVLWAAENGIVNGTGDGTTFSPNDKITREQIALLLYNYCKSFKKLDVSKTDDLAAFSDKGEVSSWALDGVRWAVGEKLINGRLSNGRTLLAPKGNAKRCELAVLLMSLVKNITIPAGRAQ